MSLITTSVIGSHAPPSWFVLASAAAERGEMGAVDLEEMFRDATRLAIADQEEAGVDLVTDGEMRRVDFVLGFYDRLTGLEKQPAPRIWGPDAHDQRGHWLAVAPITAPDGLGAVAEFELAREIATRPLKVPLPGPYTLAGRIVGGAVYPDREAIARELCSIVRAEIEAVVAAGATHIQLDEPSAAVRPDRPGLFVELLNRCVEGISAHLSLHLCFGNYRGRAVGRRSYRPLFPHILEVAVDQLHLEFANRELAEIELCGEIAAAGKQVAAGLIDVKNLYCETPDEVAERIRRVLEFVLPEQLTVSPDCGFSQTVRWACLAKLKAMCAGAAMVRAELEGRR